MMSNDDAPRNTDSLSDALRLAMLPGVGPRLRRALLDHFGTSAAALAAPESHLRDVPGIGATLSRRIAAARDTLDPDAEIELAAEHGIRIVADADPDYPRLLRELPDPPGILFIRGELRPADEMAIAMVGARHATHYGRTTAEKLAGSLARAGLTIVSGLARGIDAASHRGALAVGGRTIAVLGSGILNVYPPEHRDLADEVAASGALLSEAPLRAAPMSGTFPQRNRLISGLSLGTIVVEAASRSGSLITARHAMEQGREVFAVPGRVDSRTARGCHRLIRDGARLVETADDVLEELGPLVAPTSDSEGRAIHHPAELQLNDVERLVLDAVRKDPTPIDELLAQLDMPTSQVLATLSVLEMRRLVRRGGGGVVFRP